jgi:DNA-binding response OmpR family regulator
MVFVSGGEAALAELRVSSFNVVVSDLRMPGIDGVALLAHVRACSPATGRIMLSGAADEHETERETGVVDVLLSKPCDSSALRAAIELLITRSMSLVSPASATPTCAEHAARPLIDEGPRGRDPGDSRERRPTSRP